MSFIIFDTEYIAEKGLLEKGFDGWKNREIIQIAALKVDESLEVEEKFNVYIKPVRNKEISEYFSNLTGIDNEKIAKEGIDFVSAYKAFRKFVEDKDCYSHGWGDENNNDADGEVVREMLAYYGVIDNNPPKYKNIAFWFREKYLEKNINITSQSSGEIAKLLGQDDKLEKLNLSPHNAFYDVYSILVGLRFLKFNHK